MKKNTPSKISNPQSLRVLMIEDSEDDILLIIRELKKGGYNPVYEQVETAAAMKKALQEKQWDIILCDYSLPKFNAPSAIAVLKNANIDIPVIIVSGTIGEDVGIECMRLGAHDYIMKGNLSRLCPAIARELEEEEVRNKQRQAESQREAALEALRESEYKYKSLIENIPGIILTIDLKGTITFISRRTNEILGYEDSEMINMAIFNFIPEEDHQRAMESLQKGMKGRKIKHFQIPMIAKSGEKVFFESSFTRIYKDGAVVGAQGTAIDITERKHAEEALRLSEENFRRSLEDLPLGVRIVTIEGDTIYANQAILDIYGYNSMEELKTTPVENRYTPASFAEYRIRREKRKRGDDASSEYDIDILRKHGEVRHLHVFRKDILWNGERQFQVLYSDITDRKRIENVLRESEEKYRLLFDTVPVGIAITDLEGIVHTANRSHQEITGYTLEELDAIKIADLYVDPEQRQQILQVLRESSQVRDYEVRFRRKDGTVRAVLLNIERIERDDGRELFLTVIRDITDRKQVEKALQKSEEKYRNLFNNAEVGMFRTRLDGSEILEFNEKYLKILGYTFDEVKGTPSIDIWADKRERDRMVKLLKAEGQMTNFECGLLNKQGEVRTCISSLRLYRDIGILEGSIIDITERKQAEEQIHASLKEKELLLSEVHHRVKNNMQVISGLLDLPAALSGNQERRKMFHDSQSRIHAMSLVHEKLYGSNDFARIDLPGYVKTLSQDLFQTYKIHPGEIYLIIQTDGDVYIDINKAIPCGLILNELISNALKHAFLGNRHGELQIIIRETKNTEIEIVVRDNGVGLPEDVDIHQPRSAGFHLVNGLVRNQLGGQIEVRRDAGTVLQFKFPL